jgi:hypothetical protein
MMTDVPGKQASLRSVKLERGGGWREWCLARGRVEIGSRIVRAGAVLESNCPIYRLGEEVGLLMQADVRCATHPSICFQSIVFMAPWPHYGAIKTMD